jgi:phosphatidylglycerol:prolipoprotein diacylglycerol transferase
MFPDFQYLFNYLFGIDIPALSFLKTFGFFVAVAFIIGAYFIRKELLRYAKEGKFKGIEVNEVINKPISNKDIITNTLIGFIVGYKIIGLFNAGTEASNDPMSIILSLKGSFVGGIILAALFTYLKWKEAQNIKDKKQEIIKTKKYPHQMVADIILIAAISGFAGAKIFNALETWDSFIHNPIESLLSGSGLTYYGGLILAIVALYFFAKKKNFSFKSLCDAVAPTLILAYGIGRLGCQFAGDGDWGIYNSAYMTQNDGTLIQVAPGVFENFVVQNPQLFIEFNGKVPHKYSPAPSANLVPLYAQNYKHNVNREGFRIAGDNGNYPTVLPAGVFPTPVYEFFACIVIFLVLMALRKRFNVPLQLFGIYLIFNGLERFLVEKIRVNTKYDLGFMQPTQAEIISFVFILIGLYLLLLNPLRNNKSIA